MNDTNVLCHRPVVVSISEALSKTRHQTGSSIPAREVVMGEQQLMGLSVEEDEALRRLQWFEDQGWQLSEDQQRLKASIRARDRRQGIRIPRQVATPIAHAPAAGIDLDA
jgi:hypothetical protein